MPDGGEGQLIKTAYGHLLPIRGRGAIGQDRVDDRGSENDSAFGVAEEVIWLFDTDVHTNIYGTSETGDAHISFKL